ncbi:MAG: hypothetical protein C0501_27380 [Isosphaera sp.]|nr:hypothetical protein [Isosphaera sp.]
MAKKVAKETSTPLIVALVFFVLTTIAFGVMWYMEYAERENNAAKVKAEADKTKAANSATKDAELLAKLYRVLLGVQEGDDETSLLAEHKAGDKLATELKRVNGELAKKLGAGDAGKLPDAYQVLTLDDKDKIERGKPAGVTDAVATAAKDRDAAIARGDAAQTLYDAERTKTVAAKKLLDEATASFTKLVDALPKDYKAKLEDEIKKFEARKALFTQNEAESRKELDEAQQRAGIAERERDKVAAQIKAVQTQLAEKVTQLARRQDTFQFDEPQGKVVGKNLDGTVTIDLGSNDRVTPGLTFTLLPYDFPVKGRQSRIRRDRVPDERGNYKDVDRFQPKATVEVIEVTGPSSSRCRLTSEYDPIRDGVIAGDLLYNSVWRKGAADHVALIGIFDRNGDGSDDIEQVVRDLERMGVRVDAFFDMRTRKWSNPITNQTRYLVKGFFPSNSGADPNRDEKTRLLDDMSKAVNAAREKNVTEVEFREFFPRMGYKMAIDLPVDKLNAATAPYLRRAGELPPTGGGPAPGN